MTWSFDNRPDSLATLARNSREQSASTISSIEIDVKDGTIIVGRSTSDAPPAQPRFFMYGNIFDGSDPSWKYLAGAENIDFVVAVREFAETTSLDVQTIFLRFENGALANFHAFQPNGGVSNVIDDQVVSALDDLFNPGATVNNALDQFLYGDTDRKNAIGTPKRHDYRTPGQRRSDRRERQ